MKQFDLSIWLQDKSRKICTREGRPVRIVCWDSPNKVFPIVGFVDNEPEIFAWDCFGYCREGHIENENDLFFADEKEELTEFEEVMVSFAHTMFDHLLDKTKEVDIKEWKEKLLDLARKEIRKEQQEKLGTLEMPIDVTEPYYIKGKQDALKSLPKWKKATEHKDLEKHIAILEDDKVLLSNYLEEGDYYIDLEDLKTLPKEE